MSKCDKCTGIIGICTRYPSQNILKYSVFVFLAVIALKSAWQVEVSEKGDVRLWLQTENLSNAAELRLIFNDREISSTPVRTATQVIPRYRGSESTSVSLALSGLVDLISTVAKNIRTERCLGLNDSPGSCCVFTFWKSLAV